MADNHTCFDCKKPIDDLTDIRIVVEDEGTQDIFWGPAHNACKLARIGMWDQLEATALELPGFGGTD